MVLRLAAITDGKCVYVVPYVCFFPAAEAGLWADHCPIRTPFWVSFCPACRVVQAESLL